MREYRRGGSRRSSEVPLGTVAIQLTNPAIEILYEDNHILGISKPSGLLAQGDRTGDVTALVLARAYLKDRYHKPGRVFLGLVQRLDRPVSGVMVFARTSKAASRLTRAFRDRAVDKTYLAVVVGAMRPDQGELSGLVERAHTRSRMASEPTPRSREAALEFRVLARDPEFSLVEVRPRTGRHHQIRLQLSAAGHPIAGDLKYRARQALPDRAVALHAARLRFAHPVRGDVVEISTPPRDVFPWNRFTGVIRGYFA
jgi:23S rRNA pseudouridine1911/1915/1917 synthase